MEETAIGVLLAILAVMLWGVGNTVARVGLQSIKAASGAVVSLVTSLIVALIIVLVFEFDALVSVSLVAIAWFALNGIVHFALGRLFFYQGMKYIGAARVQPLGSSAPLFALVLAVIFLEETPTILVIIGTLSIVGGLYLLLSEGSETSVIKKNRILGYGFGLATGLCWGASAVVIRYASQFASPFVVLAFSLLFGTVVLSAATGKNFEIGVRTNKKAIYLLLLAGVLNGVAGVSYYSALAVAPVVVVSPISASTPLIVTLCVHLFLQRLERVTRQVVIGCLLIVIGGALVATY